MNACFCLNYPTWEAYSSYCIFFYGLSASVIFFFMCVLSHKRNDCQRKIMCFGFLYKNYLKHFSFQEVFSEILSQMYKRLHVNCPLLLSDFNET